MYHRIGRGVANSIVRDQYVPETLFERQLLALKKQGYQSISLDEMQQLFFDGAREGKYFVITFDDGYKSFSDRAIPILKDLGMRATVFLVSSCIGHTNRWDEAKGDVSEPLMGPQEIKQAHAEGMEIGAHTRTHPDLRFCNDSLAREEIVGSKKAIEEALVIPINWFSYPFGKHSQREHDLAKSAGYKGATGTDKHLNNAQTNPFALGRINVRATTSPAYLLHKLKKAGHG